MTTVRREIKDEASLDIAWAELPPIIFAKDLQTGFIQLILLGVPIFARDLAALKDSAEGSIERISWSELPKMFANTANWVPSGRAHLLAWLAIGAPRSIRIAGRSPTQLFDMLVP